MWSMLEDIAWEMWSGWGRARRRVVDLEQGVLKGEIGLFQWERRG